jgi:hypothetical protein
LVAFALFGLVAWLYRVELRAAVRDPSATIATTASWIAGVLAVTVVVAAIR